MIYLDTSALVKLVWTDERSAALRRFLERSDRQGAVSSVVLTLETRRAVQRNTPSLLPRADLVLTRVGQVGLTPAVVESASRLPDPTLRSLDAIHLATALLLGDEVSAFVSYDRRLLAAAAAHGLPATAPA